MVFSLADPARDIGVCAVEHVHGQLPFWVVIDKRKHHGHEQRSPGVVRGAHCNLTPKTSLNNGKKRKVPALEHGPEPALPLSLPNWAEDIIQCSVIQLALELLCALLLTVGLRHSQLRHVADNLNNEQL